MPGQTTSTPLARTPWGLWIAPNLPACILGLGGLMSDMVLLRLGRDSIYAMGGIMPVLASLLLAWFWLTLAWITWGLLRLVRLWWRRSPTWAAVFSLALILLSSAGAVIYLVSWGFYLRAGRFIGLEITLRILEDGPELWQYLATAQPSDLLVFGCVSLLACAGLLVSLRCLMLVDGPGDPADIRRAKRAVWCALTLVASLVFRIVAFDDSDLRRVPRMESLKLRLNPTFALFATFMDRVFDEKIENCLDTTTLEPMAPRRLATAAAPRPDRPSIVFVVIEALRHDVIHLTHQGRAVMPELDALADGGMDFTRAYAQSTHTDYAEPCIVSSLYPLRTRRHHFYRTSDAWPKTLIYDVLQPAGYATALISSENLQWGSMDSFFESPHLDFIYDAERSEHATAVHNQDEGFAFETRRGALRAGKLDDNVTCDRAIDWIGQQNALGRPFFLYIDFQSSHFPYPISPAAPRPFQPCQLEPDDTFVCYPAAQTETVRNAYLNALHEVDHHLGRLVAALKDRGILDRTILLVTGDHGEAFHEHGLVTHAREPYEPVIRVPCVLYDPAYVPIGRDDYPAQHIDLVPTVLSLIGQPVHANFQGINLLDPNRAPLSERLLYFHTENGLARADAVLLAGRWKLMRNRRTGQQLLFDLSQDPDEMNDLSLAEPAMAERLEALLEVWRRQQLSYYYYPTYYLRFYPPAAPRMFALER